MEIKEIILDAMKKNGSPMSAGQISDATGKEKKEIEKGMKILKDENLIESPKRCFWQPKK
jgi:DNA-binding transcriptional ArsR family regulator